MKKRIIISGIVSLVLLMTGLIMIVNGITEQYTVETECYDKHNNQIQGLICNEETFEGKGTALFLFIMGMLGIVFTVIWDMYNEI